MVWILVLILSTVSSDFLTLPSPSSQSPFIKISILLPKVCFVKDVTSFGGTKLSNKYASQSWPKDLSSLQITRGRLVECLLTYQAASSMREEMNKQTGYCPIIREYRALSVAETQRVLYTFYHTPISSQELQGWLSGPSGQPVHWQSLLLIWVAHSVSDERSVTMGYTAKSISQMRSDLKSPSLRFSESK